MRDTRRSLSLVLPAIVFCSFQAALAQPLTFPTLPARVRTPGDLVPSGWQINSQALGDLNGDGLPDKVLVLLRAGKPIEGDNQLIVVAIGRGGGSYDVVIQNHALFYREVDPSYPFLWVTPVIARGTLRVKTECGCAGAGDGSEQMTFRWQQDHFNLIGYDYNYATRGSTVSASINYLTGVARIGSGHVTHTNEKDTSYRGKTVHFTSKKILAFDDIDWSGKFPFEQLCLIGMKQFCS